MKRILILRGGAVGDLVLTLPVLQALRARWPEAHLELVGYPRTNELVLAAGLADAVRSLDAAGIHLLYAPDPVLPELPWLGSFDLVIHFLHEPDTLITENLRSLHIEQVIACTPLPPPGVHAADHYLGCLSELDIEAADPLPRIELPAAEHDWVTAIHPGSGGPQKKWPLERFLALAGQLADPVFVLGEAEQQVVLPDGLPVLRDLSLSELASQLAGCSRFIGNDAGIAHLAAALGVPTTVLFGPTDPDTWAPRGPHVTVVRSPGESMGRLSLERVRESLA